jgi:hypothetical protein
VLKARAVERQREQVLQTLQAVEGEHGHCRERQERGGIPRPALLPVGVDPGESVYHTFQTPGAWRGVHPGYVVTQRPVDDCQQRKQESQLEPPGHQKRSGKMRATTRYTTRSTEMTRPTRLATITAAAGPAPGAPECRRHQARLLRTQRHSSGHHRPATDAHEIHLSIISPSLSLRS